MAKRKVIANVVVGKPQVSPSKPAHTRGVRQGNELGGLDREPGIIPQDGGARATARRSTGVNPAPKEPIDPRMPNLSPA